MVGHLERFQMAVRLGVPTLAAVVMLAGEATAHGDGYPYLYVAEDGADEGKCIDPASPCQTIAYALSRAGKGDEIRLAPGSFRFLAKHPADALKLLGRVKRVRGGFDPASEFQRRTADGRVTVISGVDEVYRAPLAKNGLLLAPRGMDPQDMIHLAQAVAPAPNTRFVAVNGTDEGDCLNPDEPCRTIAYALEQAEPGEEIRVGEGGYQLEPDTLEQADARSIRIEGSLSQASGFTARATAGPALQTVVTGPGFRQRGRLSESGLRLQQDLKGRLIEPVATSAAASLVGPAPCVDGLADGHPCKGIDRISQLPLGAFSSRPGQANDIWGFVDQNDGREYIILGLQNGTAVIDVTDPAQPTEVGTIAGQPTIWRDIKVYQHRDEVAGRWKAYAYVTADDQQPVSHGIQIVDLTNLPDSISLAATLDIVDVSHNVYVSNADYATGVAEGDLQPFVYILGSDFTPGSTRGAYVVLDVTDPTTPSIVQTPPVGATYSHDATTVTIDDARADVCKGNPCEILIDYSEDAVDIWDVTVKGNAHMLGSATYEDASYIHSGWWTEGKQFVLVQDELDELDPDEGHSLNTTVRVLEISDLTAPEFVATWTGPTRAIDHNGFALGSEYYMSNYRRGLTVLDITDPAAPVTEEKLRFDTYIEDERDTAEFNGAWGTYPYLPSGSIAVSDIEGGLFLLRKQ